MVYWFPRDPRIPNKTPQNDEVNYRKFKRRKEPRRNQILSPVGEFARLPRKVRAPVQHSRTCQITFKNNPTPQHKYVQSRFSCTIWQRRSGRENARGRPRAESEFLSLRRTPASVEDVAGTRRVWEKIMRKLVWNSEIWQRSAGKLVKRTLCRWGGGG